MLHMCLLLFGIFAICGIVCFSDAYLCLPTKHFFATVCSQIMHISRDSCKIVLWHFSQITLSWCNILLSCIWLASKLFPYAVMSKSILLVDVPLQYRHVFCVVSCNLHLASTASAGIFSANNDLSHFLQIKSFPVETTKQFDSAWDITLLSELYLDALNMMHWDLGKSDLWQHVHIQWFVYVGFCVKSSDAMWNSIDGVVSLLFITTVFLLWSTPFEFSVLKWLLQFCMTWLTYEFFISHFSVPAC